MTLQPQKTVYAPATLTDEQRQRVADALESAQSENTRRNYAGQYRKFRAWCERERQSALPAQPEVVAAYATELADDGKSMSTIRLAVAAIVHTHRRVGLDSPMAVGVSETLRGLARQVGVSQKQAKPLDADSLAAIKATAFTPRKSRGGSMESADATLRRGQLVLRWRRYSLTQACVSLRLPSSGGGTSSMPKTVRVLCTSNARRRTRWVRARMLWSLPTHWRL